MNLPQILPFSTTKNLVFGQLVLQKIKRGRGLKILLTEDYWPSSKIKVYAIPRPNTENSGFKDTIDIVVCPFKPSTWKNIYAAKFLPKTDYDEIGFISKFSDIIGRSDINILKLQSNPTFEGEPYSFWLLLDFTDCDYFKTINNDIESKIRTANNIEDNKNLYKERGERIKYKLQEDLSHMVHVKELRGVEFLYNFVTDLEKNHKQYWREVKKNPIYSFEIENHSGFLHKDVLRKTCKIERTSIYYSLISSPHQKSYFIVRIFKNENLINLDIQNEDKVGSIFKISDAIFKSNGNILSASAYIESVGERRCHYFCLVEIDTDDSGKMIANIDDIPIVNKIVIYNTTSNFRYINLKSYAKSKEIKIYRQPGLIFNVDLIKEGVKKNSRYVFVEIIKGLGVEFFKYLIFIVVGYLISIIWGPKWLEDLLRSLINPSP